MGYGYMFKLAITKIHNLNDIGNNTSGAYAYPQSDPTAHIAAKEARQRAIDEYTEHLTRDIISACREMYTADYDFPEFGVKEYSRAGGYGTGPIPEYDQQLAKLGARYPDVTFVVYLFYLDFRKVHISTIHGASILGNELSLDQGIDVGGYHLFTKFDIDNTIDDEVDMLAWLG